MTPADLLQGRALTPSRIEDLTRRELISSALAGALLLACGDGEDEEEPAAPAARRTVTDRYGPIEIPTAPQRVVALERVTLYHCLALGIQPLATTVTGTRTLAELQPDWLSVQPRSDIQVFKEEELDIEAIARLQPDLMVTYLEFKTIDSLRQIAPVYVANYSTSPQWKNLFNGIASALNKEEQAAEFVKRYEERVARFRRETLPKVQGKTVSAIRVRPNGVRIEVRNSFPGQVFADAGLARPEHQNIDTDFGYNEVSVERLKEADADYLFVIVVDNEDENTSINNLRNNPLWSSLKAAQTGQVHVVDNPTWFGGLHYLAAERMLDELASIMS